MVQWEGTAGVWFQAGEESQTQKPPTKMMKGFCMKDETVGCLVY